jgi:D-3-phosphoglycerate dehydrogenase
MPLRVFVSTVPFAENDTTPLELLDRVGAKLVLNKLGRRLTADELAEHLENADALIAGTEPITKEVMENNPNLKIISRVGVGLDNVDLLTAQKRNIEVSYTPNAPSPAVAELTISHILTLLRGTHFADRNMHRRQWERFQGKRLARTIVGVIGYGRIGSRIVSLLSAFAGCQVLVHDLDESAVLPDHARYATLEEIFREADIVTVHVPLTPQTLGLINAERIAQMKPDAFLLNTARGGIVDEEALAKSLRLGEIAGAAIDVFTQEPYDGPLCDIDTCLLSCHMGSMSIDCRIQMEIEATEEVARLFNNEPRNSPVPNDEYLIRGA